MSAKVNQTKINIIKDYFSHMGKRSWSKRKDKMDADYFSRIGKLGGKPTHKKHDHAHQPDSTD
jgi:hypothetical protein